MKTGDIVLVPFPFSDLTDIKARPAVVISETKDKYADLIVSAITSQIPSVIGPAEILLQPSLVNGLRIVSVVRVDRIFTLKKDKVIHTLGQLTANEQKTLVTIFKSLVD